MTCQLYSCQYLQPLQFSSLTCSMAVDKFLSLGVLTFTTHFYILFSSLLLYLFLSLFCFSSPPPLPSPPSIFLFPPTAAPSAPQSHTITRLSSQSILVSWSAPDPPNGIIHDYEVRVVVGLSGQLFTNRTVSVSQENQNAPQFVTIDGLDLDRVRYLVTISARTGAGRGPETETVAIGTQAPGVSV